VKKRKLAGIPSVPAVTLGVAERTGKSDSDLNAAWLAMMTGSFTRAPFITTELSSAQIGPMFEMKLQTSGGIPTKTISDAVGMNLPIVLNGTADAFE